MHNDVRFEKLHEQFEPMIYHVMKRLEIYRNEQEFYQIGCIALWDASLRFNKEKGEFKSYAYSYMLGRMKTALTEESMLKETECQVEENWIEDEKSEDILLATVTESIFDRISPLLTENQRKWIISYCIYGNTPSEIAQDEGVSISAVKAWRRDAIAKIRKSLCREDFKKRK